ncbi:MAG: phage terminase large subunit family protein [Sedimentisphaerales bacterium]|nr:phage terminase large subunit family protein [Sedimentisphaerales bacterium]
MSKHSQTAWDFAGDDDPAAANRNYQRDYMAEKRAKERDIEIPPVDDPARRAGFEWDDEGFLKYYGGHVFYNPFTLDQKEIIAGISDRVRYGGPQAIAAERGGGKSSITKWMAIKALCYGHSKYLVVLAGNGTLSSRILGDIKYEFETNDRLAADFPEICIPVRALEGAAQRAKSQTVNGHRTCLEWQTHQIVLPRIEGSPSSGSIMVAIGMDGAIRGLVRGPLRPDFVIIDDPQTRESAASRTETQSRRETIKQDILGLAGPGKIAAVMMLCTVIRCGDLADEFTDREQSPEWAGIRQRFILKWPERMDLWDEYIVMRHADQVGGDVSGRKARDFYLANRAEMDKGAAVSNPYRFNSDKHEDGSQMEVSALQHAFNLIATLGRDAFEAEYNNDPKSLTAEDIGINEMAVCKKLNSLKQGESPGDKQRTTAHIDVHGRRLDWAIVDWSAGLTGSVVNYGEQVVHAPTGAVTSDENIEHTRAAILSALLEMRELFEAATLGPVPDCVTVDSGWQPQPVYRFCKISGPKYHSVKGCGQGQGEKFRLPTGRMAPSRRGAHWFMTQPPGERIWLIKYNADHYKNAVHTGFMTPADSPGSLSLFGDKAGVHRNFARQICAEVWVREFRAGKGWIEGFDVLHHHNHKLDCVAAAMMGAEYLRIAPVERANETQQPKQKRAGRRRRTYAERRSA